MPAIRIGVIGCGVIGRKHIASAATSEAIELVAVADLDAESARTAAEAHGAPQWFDSGEALLEEASMDGVVLALPTGFRAPLVLSALERGLHVLLEKPAAMSAEELERFGESAGDRILACCSSRFQFMPYAEAVRQTLADGRLGPLRVLRARADGACGKPNPHPVPWRLKQAANGGGYLVNWGVYDLDYLMAMTGWSLQPQTVLAQTFPIAPSIAHHVAPGSDAETQVVAMVRCAGGEVILLDRGEFMATASSDHLWQIVGERGSIRQPIKPADPTRIELDEINPDTGVETRTLWEGAADWDVQHREPVRDFAAAIRDGRRPRTDYARALEILRITDAIYESAESNVAVML